MGTLSKRLAVFGLLAACLEFVVSSPCLTAEAVAADLGLNLASIGKIGPDAINLKVAMGHPGGTELKDGDPIEIRVRASKKAYITVLYVSSRGDVIVIFPNEAMTDNLILPGKEYSLFGPDTNFVVKFSEKARDAKLIFYAASKPVALDPLEIPQGRSCIFIPRDDASGMRILADKLRTMAKDPGFNKTVLAFKDQDKKGLSLKLMGLPRKVRTTKPENVTGVQGARHEASSADKE